MWVPAALLDEAGDVLITATTPAPGGGTSATATLTVVDGNPTPQLTSVSPHQIFLGQSGQQLTLRGSGFTAASTALETTTSTALPVASVIPAELIVDVPDSLVATTGQLQLTVTNPAPGGGTTATRYAVVVAQPVITSLSPSTVTAGSGAFDLTITGEHLKDQEWEYVVVIVGGTWLTPTTATATEVVVNVPGELIQSEGTVSVVVFVEGRGESSPAELTVAP